MRFFGLFGVSQVAFFAVGMGVLACSSEPASTDSGTVDLPDDRATGTFTVRLEHDGIEREAIVYVPESYSAAADTPLVMNFHGFGGMARWHMEAADLRPQADRSGGLLVIPQGADLDGSPHWNPVAAGGDNKSDVDDLGFVEALLETIQAAYPYNAGRVSAVGYSNGGMMALGLACTRSELIASAGSVSGAFLDDSCDHSHPMSIITLHGTQDSTIPYDGSGEYFSASEVIDYWRGEIGAPEADAVLLESGSNAVRHWPHDGGEAGTAVHHYRVMGGEHIWYNFEADGLSANDRIWDFLTAFSVNGRL